MSIAQAFEIQFYFVFTIFSILSQILRNLTATSFASLRNRKIVHFYYTICISYLVIDGFYNYDENLNDILKFKIERRLFFTHTFFKANLG